MTANGNAITLGSAVAIRTEVIGNNLVGHFPVQVVELGDLRLVPYDAIERLIDPNLTAGEPADDAPMLLTMNEAAARLGVSVTKLRAWVRSGAIRVTAIEGTKRIATAELERFVTEHTGKEDVGIDTDEDG